MREQSESPGPVRHPRRTVRKGTRSAIGRNTRATAHHDELEDLLKSATIEDRSSSAAGSSDSPVLAAPTPPPANLEPAIEDQEMANHQTYSPWGLPQHILSKQRFVEYDALLEFVASHRFIQFNVKANRDRIRTAFSSLRTAAPFARTARFPDSTPIVHLENTAIDCWLTQLLQALDLPDRAMEKNPAGSVEGTANDAKRSANVAFNELHRVLCNLENMASNGIYDRSTFEEHFGLSWN